MRPQPTTAFNKEDFKRGLANWIRQTPTISESRGRKEAVERISQFDREHRQPLDSAMGFWQYFTGPASGRLNLESLNLSSLPAEIGDLEGVKRLDLGYNQLTSIPAEIGNLNGLKELSLGQNQLTSLPAEIGNLSMLEWLSLGQNQLTSLPAEIGNLSSLQSLLLSSNRGLTLPAEIVKLRELACLSFSGNGISSVPAEIEHLSSLQVLDLDSNRLTTIPDFLLNSSQIFSLDIRRNPIPAEEFTRLIGSAQNPRVRRRLELELEATTPFANRESNSIIGPIIPEVPQAQSRAEEAIVSEIAKLAEEVRTTDVTHPADESKTSDTASGAATEFGILVGAGEVGRAAEANTTQANRDNPEPVFKSTSVPSQLSSSSTNTPNGLRRRRGGDSRS
jgi:hypothetical protein